MLQKQIILSKLCDQAFELDKYIKIMERLKNKESIVQDKDFQKLYNAFYGVRRNEEWREKYYKLFQDCREAKFSITFEYILKKLYVDVGQVEASFASKMLASLNFNMPLLDRRVLKYFELEIQGNSTEKRITNAIEIYYIIVKKYQEKEQQDLISFFNELFPNYPYEISDIKKIDCFTWMLGNY